MHRKVKYARLQTELDFPGTVGAIGKVLPPQNKTLHDLDMSATEGGLLVSFNFIPQLSQVKIHKDILIPYPNVVVMDLVPEPVKPALSLKDTKVAS